MLDNFLAGSSDFLERAQEIIRHVIFIILVFCNKTKRVH